jgi:hypothetical protein
MASFSSSQAGIWPASCSGHGFGPFELRLQQRRKALGARRVARLPSRPRSGSPSRRWDKALPLPRMSVWKASPRSNAALSFALEVGIQPWMRGPGVARRSVGQNLDDGPGQRRLRARVGVIASLRAGRMRPERVTVSSSSIYSILRWPRIIWPWMADPMSSPYWLRGVRSAMTMLSATAFPMRSAMLAKRISSP